MHLRKDEPLSRLAVRTRAWPSRQTAMRSSDYFSAPSKSDAPSSRRQHELIAILVLENRRCSPGFLLRRLHELNATRAQLVKGLLHAISHEGDAGERSDPVFLTRGRKQHDLRVGARDAQLDPAPAIAEGLIGHNLEAELLGVELEGLVLISHGDADELDGFDH